MASRKRLILTYVVVVTSIGVLVLVIVAVVHGVNKPATLTISNVQLQEELAHKNAFYHNQHNEVDQQTLRHDVIDQLARDLLVREYAKTHNIRVAQAEIDSTYQQRVHTAKSEQTLLSNLYDLYGIDKQQYRSNIELDILKEKVQTRLNETLKSWLSKRLAGYRVIVSD